MQRNRHQKTELRHAAVMLAPVLPGSAIELEIKAEGRVRGTAPAVVNGTGLGKKHDSFARLAEAIAPVDIFAVHKKLGIEQPDAVHRRAAHHDKPAVQNF